MEETQEYWKEEAQNKLFEEVNHVNNNNQAKNIIFFLGDGMGISTLTAARSEFNRKGQTRKIMSNILAGDLITCCIAGYSQTHKIAQHYSILRYFGIISSSFLPV